MPCHPHIWADKLPLSQPGGQIVPTTLLLLAPLELLDLPTALKIGECPSCLEGEVKPLRAESKLTGPVTKVQAKTSHFEVFFNFEN